MDEDQLTLIRRIARVVGHELRNPLAVINNSTYFLKTKLGQDGKLDPKVEKHLGIVVSEVGRADRMIAEILAYSRALEIKPARFSLNALVETAVAAAAVTEKINIKKELAKGMPEVEVDEALFGGVLKRLLDNAIDALPAEGGVVTVTTAIVKKEAVVAVKDAGAGIKTEILPLLFEPFATTKPRGLGLSLAMVKKIVLAHKGRVEGGNKAGGGAEFRISLPA